MSAGRRLIVSYLDELAFLFPNKLWALLPNTDNPRDGFQEITYSCLKNAIDYCAWHLEAKLGRSMTFETFTFLSHPFDIRYQILAIAAMKIGWNAFFSSPRNSLQAHLSLLDQAQCHVWLVGEVIDPIVTQVQKQRPMKTVDIPTLDFLLSNSLKVPHYPYNKTFEQARLDPCLVLHTSGSTGTPKIIVCKHTLFTSFDAYNKPEHSTFHWNYFRGLRAFMPFPNFHMAGLSASLGANVYFDVINVLPPWKMPTAELANSYHQHAGVDVSILAASVLNDLANNDLYVQNLGNLKYIGNCAGPVSEELGTALSEYCHPMNLYGVTETSVLGSNMLLPEDWQYFCFSGNSGAEFRPLSSELYEMVIMRKQGMRDYQHTFSTFPDRTEWPTRDLFTKHPTKPDLWLLVGRVDDIIVFSNGEKHNPVTFEEEVSVHPLVAGAVVFGQGRAQAGLLIESKALDDDDIKELFWPTVQKSNKNAPAHAKIAKDMILIAKAEKPFPRAGKGTVQRKACLELYAEDIDELYKQNENLQEGSLVESSDANIEAVAQMLEEWMQDTLGQDPPERDEDLFNAGIGFDSLAVMRLVRFINSSGMATLATPAVYENPTISGLAELIGGSPERLSSARQEQTMSSLMERFAEGIPSE